MNRIIAILLLVGTPLFSQNTAKDINYTDKHGLKQGNWMKLYENSEVKRYEGQFKNDKAVGKFIYYYPTGEIQTTVSHRANDRSFAKYFYQNGALMAFGAYQGELKDSTWTYYNEYSEKKAIDYYVVGKLYGNCLKFHRNGQILEERYFENNLEQGPYKEYFENGIVARKANFENGSLEGEGVFYHPNGNKKFEGNYFKNTKHGIWKTYDENGKLTDERNYIKGVPEYRESDIMFEDTTKYYRKDRLEMEDFIDEDYMAIPPDDKEKSKPKKK